MSFFLYFNYNYMEKGGIFIKDYIINNKTIAIIGVDSRNSKVIEDNGEIIVNENCFEIIENSCLYYGSSYNGRLEASSKIIKCSYKMPIIIDNSNNLVFFPTMGPYLDLCIWINIDKIYNIDIKNNILKINFKNNSFISTNMSLYSLENQMLKSYNLLSIIKDRI